MKEFPRLHPFLCLPAWPQLRVVKQVERRLVALRHLRQTLVRRCQRREPRRLVQSPDLLLVTFLARLQLHPLVDVDRRQALVALEDPALIVPLERHQTLVHMLAAERHLQVRPAVRRLSQAVVGLRPQLSKLFHLARWWKYVCRHADQIPVEVLAASRVLPEIAASQLKPPRLILAHHRRNAALLVDNILILVEPQLCDTSEVKWISDMLWSEGTVNGDPRARRHFDHPAAHPRP